MSTACPNCESSNTIQTDRGRDYCSWYCYGCRRAYELYDVVLPKRASGAERRRGTDRRTNRSALNSQKA